MLDETQRYDIMTSSCISSCMSGERWESVILGVYDSINSDVGRCVSCGAGRYSVGSVDGWVDTCLSCSVGKYVATNGSSTCLECDVGTYTSLEGQSACDLCSTGTYSEFSKGSSTCRNCTEGTYASSSEQSICSVWCGTHTSTQGKSLCEGVLKVDSVELTRGSTKCLNALREHSPKVQQRVLLVQEVGIPHTTRRLFVRYVLQVITPGVWMRVARCV